MDSTTPRGLAAIAAAAEPQGAHEHGAVLLTAGPGKLKIGLSPEEHAAALAEAKTEGKKEGAAAAATGERARIAAIVNAPEAKGREGLANHLAFNTELAPDAAIAMLKAAPAATPEKTSRLDALMAGKNPDVETEEAGTHDAAVAGLAAAVQRQQAKIERRSAARAAIN